MPWLAVEVGRFAAEVDPFDDGPVAADRRDDSSSPVVHRAGHLLRLAPLVAVIASRCGHRLWLVTSAGKIFGVFAEDWPAASAMQLQCVVASYFALNSIPD